MIEKQIQNHPSVRLIVVDMRNNIHPQSYDAHTICEKFWQIQLSKLTKSIFSSASSQ